MSIELILLVILIGFALQFFDAFVGMGFGTVTPLLILLGVPALEAVPAVIFSSLVLSLLAGVMHHQHKNVDFTPGSKSFKATALLSVMGVIAVIFGVMVAISVPPLVLNFYIGLLTLAIGLLVVFKKAVHRALSWKRLAFLGALASFNKGMTGGGYGPVLAGGQLLAGVESRKAVAITALSEGIVSLAGFTVFILVSGWLNLNWTVTGLLVLGGLFSTPLAVKAVKQIEASKLKTLIGLVSVVSGLAVIYHCCL